MSEKNELEHLDNPTTGTGTNTNDGLSKDNDSDSVSVLADPDADVSAVTHSLPFTTWLVILAGAILNGAVSGYQITALFWASAIIESVGGGAEKLWLGQSFQVVTAAVGPILARIGDLCGRRYLILFGTFFGMLGCIVLATAKTMNIAILGTSLCGLAYGSAGNGLSIPSEILPRRHRGTAQVLTFAGAVGGVLVGLYAGAGFITLYPSHSAADPGNTDYEGWRSAIWLEMGLFFLSFVLYLCFYWPEPVHNPGRLSVMQRVAKVDWVGCVLLGCAVTPVMIGLIWGGVVFPWHSAAVISTLVVGFFFFVVLGAHQVFVKKDGLFHHALFANRNFAVCLVSILVEGMVYNVFTSYYGEETGVLWDARPYLLSTRFAAFVFAAFLAAFVFAIIVYRYRSAKEVLIFGYASFTVGFIGMATVTPGTNKVAILWCFFCGMGFAAPLVFLNVVTQLAVQPQYIGLATSLVISSRSVGGAIGIAICGAVFNAKIAAKLPAYIAEAVVAAGLPASSAVQVVTGLATSNLTLAESAPGVNATILEAGGAAALKAYSDSFRYVWLVGIPFVVCGLLGLLLLKSTKKEMNAIVDRANLGLHEHAHEHHHEHHHDGELAAGEQKV